MRRGNILGVIICFFVFVRFAISLSNPGGSIVMNSLGGSLLQPKRLPDNFVEYYDENTGVSYSYNGSYVLSTDDEEAMKELEEYSTKIYEAAMYGRSLIKKDNEDAQFYIFRNSANKIDYKGNNIVYSDAGKMPEGVSIYGFTEAEYNEFTKTQGKLMESNSMRYNIIPSEKYVTIAGNEYLHIKAVANRQGVDFIIEQYYLQLKNGYIVNFLVTSLEPDYEGVNKYLMQMLESVKIN